MLVHGYNPPKDYLFEEAWLMSEPRIKYKRVILVIGRKDICGVSLSLYIARNGSILQFLHNLLDCKRLCLSRHKLLQFCRPSRLCFFAAIQSSVLFGSGSDDRPMLTQFDQILYRLQIFLNLDPINVNCF